jgi:hypothetical protein
MLPLLASLVVALPHSTADSLDACALYTRDEVAAFAGEEKTKKPRAFSANPAHSSCTTESISGKWFVKVYIERSPDKQTLQLSLDALKKVGGLKPVSGLGEEAYWGQVSPTKGQFHVIVGTTMVSIQTYGKADGAGTMDKTRPIADQVIQRYKQRYAQ